MQNNQKIVRNIENSARFEKSMNNNGKDLT